MDIIKPSDFNADFLKKVNIVKHKVGNPGIRKSKKREIKNIVTAFDIETTRIALDDKFNYISDESCREIFERIRMEVIEHFHSKKKDTVNDKQITKKIKDIFNSQVYYNSVMYIWQLCLYDKFTIVGRTWNELKDVFNKIKNVLNEDETIVVWVHNLSYEFQFLKNIFDLTTDDIFYTDKRKILKFTTIDKKLEFRCSYIHSNMSLKVFLEKMKTKVQKLDGDVFDYSKKRFSWTDLSDYELEYSVNDVVGLCEAITKEMEIDGDTLETIPLTSTGYVRRECKKALKKYNQDIKIMLPDYQLYKALREEFQGGVTHANRFFSGYVLKHVKSKDMSSSYPARLCNEKYPYGKFFKCVNPDVKDLRDLVFRRKKAIIARVALKNLKMRDKFFGFPPLSLSKCRHEECVAVDNGKILSAKYLETTVNEVDLEVLNLVYNFDIEIIDMWYTSKRKLPSEFIKTLQKMYRDKTELKDVEGQEIFYVKQKNKINGAYGMAAQDPVRDVYIYRDKILQNMDESDPLFETEQDRFNESKPFMPYQWGCWTTSYARYYLYKGLLIVGDNGVYCDTDSVKYIEDYEGQYENAFNEFNEWAVGQSEDAGSYATDKYGVTHFMGVYETERTYQLFKTLGAKKYVYKYYDADCKKDSERGVNVTISGVVKNKGGRELEKNGGIDAFKEGFIFVEAGGSDVIYNDYKDTFVVDIEGHKQLVTSNAVIVDSTYEVSITQEYSDLLKYSAKYLTYYKKRGRI